MDTARLFINGGSQAVRLPRNCRFDAAEVCIAKIGDMVILYPRDKAWTLFASGIRGFTDDFMTQREQPRRADRRRRL